MQRALSEILNVVMNSSLLKIDRRSFYDAFKFIYSFYKRIFDDINI